MTDDNNLVPLQWEDIYSIDIAEIDEEHNGLLSMLNICIDIANGVDQEHELDDILIELIEHTKFHFQHEEQIFLDCDYPHLLKHKEVHQRLLREVAQFKKEYEQDKLTLESLINFLTSWLKDHMMGMDRVAGSYCTASKEQRISLINNQTRILLVDSEKETHYLLHDAMSDYNIISTYSSTEALDILNTEKVDIILLNVSMPDIDGYETCKQIRAQEFDMPPIPIIFLSDKIFLENIIKGYDVGGTDYLTKPFKLSELRAKINIEVKKFNLAKTAQENLSEVTEAVLSVQNTNAKIYSICLFLQQSFFCKDIESLCELFFTVTQGFGTEATIYIHSQESSAFYNSEGTQHSMSNSILEQVYSKGGRIFQFGKDRAVFNWKLASVLVNNLQDDVDNIALLMDGFEMGLKAIEASNKFEAILTDYKELKYQQGIQVSKIFNDVVYEIQGELSQTGYDSLSEEQEVALIRIIEAKSDMVDELFNQDLKMDEELSNVMSNLRTDNSNVLKEDDDGIVFL
ncbi:MAG: bacteriohemerythrin [Gammaproteobacteria bacterium]|nr:bacteriohemerythrin [Gammaproteobacteria bacterium]